MLRANEDADDPDIEAIRQRRLAELQMQKTGGDEQRKRETEERRAALIQQVLTPEARERLSRIHLVKPEKARAVEDMILRAAQSGQLGGMVDEQNLISLLGQLSKNTTQPKITIQRKKRFDEDD